jgi:hypothetical protein
MSRPEDESIDRVEVEPVYGALGLSEAQTPACVRPDGDSFDWLLSHPSSIPLLCGRIDLPLCIEG